MVRRVVTGHKEGLSVVLSDGPAKAHELGRTGSTLFDMWRTARTPTPISAVEPDPVDLPLDFGINQHGVRIRILDMASGSNDEAPYMHRTETIDYGMVLAGEMCLLLDTQEVVLKAGDSVIQRGTNHAWVNRSGRPCKMLFVMMGGEFDAALRDIGEKFSPEGLAAMMRKP